MTEVAALGLRVAGVTDIDSASSSLDRFTKSSKSADQASGRLTTESRNTSKSLADVAREGDKSSVSISKLAGAAKAAGGVLAAAFSVAAVSGGIKASLRTYADFESQMAKVGAVSRASEKDFKALTETAKRLGAETEFSASQAGAGLEFLARAGWSAKESIAAMPAVLNLATSAAMDLGKAADVASNIMSAFGIAATDAAQVTDVLAAASSRANTDVAQLGDAMSYVGPIAASLKISMGDTAAAIGALSDAGIQGSSAGTGLRRVLSSLANPTKASADEIRSLGISMADVNPQANNLADIIDTLAKGGIGAASAMRIFGDRGGPALLALVEQRSKVRELAETLGDVSGEAQRMAETIGDTLEGDLKGLSSALEGVRISLGEAFSSAARESVQKATAAVRAFGDNISTVLATVTLATKLTSAYVVAVYAIPAAKMAASAATAAYTTVLRLFSAQAAITTKQLLTMRTSLNVVFAAFAGWEIGAYLRNEFEIVEKAGIALMGGLHTIAVTIAGEFAIMGERVKFALTNPFDFARGAIADFFGWIAGLGKNALKLIGFEDLAAGIDTEFKGIRGAVASEHAAMLKEMRSTTQSEVAGINDIYAEMFADVGRSSSQAAKTVETLNNETETLNNTVTELSAAQKALTTAFEQTLANYHKQLNLAEDATLQEQLLYEIQHGRLQGLLPAQAKMLEGMARELDMRNKLAQAEADQKEIDRDRDAIARELMTEEEAILASYARRKAIVEAATFENEQARTDLLLRLENERNEALIEANGSYWERWLLAAEENILRFDDLSKTVVDNFTTSFGNAFESMILDSENLGDAMRNMAQGMVRAVVNAIGQMIAQWLAYQAVQMLVGKTTQTGAVAAMTANAEATSLQAGLAAFASTAAIPIVGPAAAPAAMSAALGVTQPMVGAVAASASAGLAGFQRGGYTGSMGVNEVAGVVHGREYVFDAASTARIGIDNLEAMRTGKALPSAGAIPSTSGSTQPAPSPVVVNLFEDSSRGGDVEQRQREDGSMEVNVFVADIMSNGPRARAIQQAFGLRRQGR